MSHALAAVLPSIFVASDPLTSNISYWPFCHALMKLQGLGVLLTEKGTF
jgi:hypothetical protein